MENALLLHLHKNPHVTGNINLLARYCNARITNQHSEVSSIGQNRYCLGLLLKSFFCIFTDIDTKYNITIRVARVDKFL